MKDKKILDHYKYLFDNYLFDEYDVLGFLIFIREQIDASTCHFIQEFADLIAHRTRNQGIIKENIVKSINSNYSCNNKGHVIGYNGVKWDTWVNEWNRLGKQIDFDFSKDKKQLLKQITICIISLAQDTKYYEKDVIIGKVEVFMDKDKNLLLVTTEGRSDSLMVCLMKCGPFNNIVDKEDGFFDYPLETKRENGKLCLYHNDEKILEI